MKKGAIVFALLSLLLAAACSDEPFDEFEQEMSHEDAGVSVDAAAAEDTAASGDGSSVGICSAVCPPAQGSTVCLQGRVFEAMSLFLRGADQATLLTKSDKIQVSVYDPIAYVSNPLTPPMSTVEVDDNGCFMVERVDIPIAGAFALLVEDADMHSADLVAPTATLDIPTSGKNSEDIELYSFASTMANDMDLMIAEGSMILFYRNRTTGKGEPGVTPLIDDQPPPWDDREVRFFADDPVNAPYFEDGVSETTSSGLVVIPGAQVKTYSGSKAGCTVETSLGGTAPPQIILVRIMDVNGC